MRPLRSILTFGLAAVALASWAPSADAQKKGKKYHFVMDQVAAAKTVAADKSVDLVEPTRAQAAKAIAAHPQLTTLEGAPDTSDVKKFKAYLARKKIAGAYKVNVEITSFEEELEDKDASQNGEKRLVIRLSLRMFSETIPERKMGFAGDGHSTIKVDVGKKLRPKDRTYAIQQAIEIAIEDALATSLKQLANPPKPPKK